MQFPVDTFDPPTDLELVLENEINNTGGDIYFLQNNSQSRANALKLRDAVLSLRKDGAFVAVPLFRVNYGPVGPHPVGSYEIWTPTEGFASVYSYLTLYRGDLSVLIHPLTREQKRDHDERASWLGSSFGIDLSRLPVLSPTVPFQYPSLKLGYNASPSKTTAERKEAGKKLEELLEAEPEAAEVPA